MSTTSLTILNRYRLVDTPEAFLAAIGRLARRVETEGHPGVLGYRFFASGAEGAARAVVDYSGPDAWIGHHDLAMGWPEMRALHQVARLEEIVFLGLLTPEIRTWIDGSQLTARIVEGYEFAAGFRRPALVAGVQPSAAPV